MREDYDTLIIAPHAGIEPGTGEIAQAVAEAGRFAVYCYTGRRVRSTRFREPFGLAAVRRAWCVVSLHGLQDRSSEYVMVGGRDHITRSRLSDSLRSYGVSVQPPTPGVAGISRRNICNLGLTGAGVQVEMSWPLRMRFLEGDAEPLITAFLAVLRH